MLDKNKYEKNKEYVKTMANTALNAILLDDLIKTLMTKYNITTYIK